MVDKETAVQTKFHSFLKQRNSKTNGVMQEAQRLVNLYRILNDFGEDFVNEYNTMLKNSSDEVQMALKALVAGQEVCQYLEFLKSEDQKEDQKNSTEEANKQVGWLPSCEQEAAQSVGAKAGSNFISIEQWQSFVQDQNERLAKATEELRAEQNAALTRLMDQLSLLKPATDLKQTGTSKVPPPQYSEIIEEKK